jgi:hypothetical protein
MTLLTKQQFKEASGGHHRTVKERLLVQLEEYMNSLAEIHDRADPRWRVWSEDEFVVRIYLNLDNLKCKVSQSDASIDLLPLENIMWTLRTTRMQWDVTNVGPGSEKVGLRIKCKPHGRPLEDETIEANSVLGDWELNHQDPSCVHAILGLCHDSGYVDELKLDKVSEYSSLLRQITLLTSKSTHRDSPNLCLPIVAWDNIFCSQPTDYTKPYTGRCLRQDSALAMMLRKKPRKMSGR